MSVIHMGKTNLSDSEFYSRWGVFGQVASNPLGVTLPEVKILILDQYSEIDNISLAAMRNLKIIASATTGETHLRVPREIRPDVEFITLKNDKEFLTGIRAVSELVFRYILTFARPFTSTGWSLAGKTIGIIGLGRIGTHVLEIAKAFQMNVLTHEANDPIENLLKLVHSASYITVHIPETLENRDFISDDLIRRMRRSCIFINTSRSSIVNEYALFKAVSGGHIRGVALDTWSSAINWKTFNQDKVILTPHIGGSTYECRRATEERLLELVKAKYFDMTKFRNNVIELSP